MKAVAHRGTQRRLDRVVAKLLTGQPIGVVLIGGSISASKDGWGSIALETLKEMFPPKHGNHTLTNAAVPATGPEYMYSCLEGRIDDHARDTADLVLLEYGANGGDEWPFRPAETIEMHGYEKLIRKLLRLPSQPAVLQMTFSPVLGRRRLHGADWEYRAPPEPPGPKMFATYYSGTQDFQEMTAKYYDLPVLSVRDAFWSTFKRTNDFDRNEEIMRREAAAGAGPGPALEEVCGEEQHGCLHPWKPQGLFAMVDILVWFLRGSAARVRASARARSSGGDPSAALQRLSRAPTVVNVKVHAECGLLESGSYLPAPMTIGNVEDGCWKRKCFFTGDLTALLGEARRGFAFSNEEFSNYAAVPKPGYIAAAPGDFLVLHLDTSRDRIYDPGRLPEYQYYVHFDPKMAPNDEKALVVFGLLTSYEKMGVVEISCVSGCECPPVETNTHKDEGEKKSVTTLFPVTVSRSPDCQMKLQVLERTTSGEHKVKLSVIAIDADLRADANNAWKGLGDGAHIMYDQGDADRIGETYLRTYLNRGD